MLPFLFKMRSILKSAKKICNSIRKHESLVSFISRYLLLYMYLILENAMLYCSRLYIVYCAKNVAKLFIFRNGRLGRQV